MAAKGALASTQIFWGGVNIWSAIPGSFVFSEKFCTRKVILGAGEIGLGLNSLFYIFDKLYYTEPTLQGRDFVILLDT